MGVAAAPRSQKFITNPAIQRVIYPPQARCPVIFVQHIIMIRADDICISAQLIALGMAASAMGAAIITTAS